MLRKQSKIIIYDRVTDNAKFSFDIVSSVIIEKSRNSFTDTCEIVFPNRLRRKDNLVDKIAIGDRITVELGYFPNLIKEFEGYISFTDKNSPLVIKCEDASFLLKRKSLPATTLKKTTIQKLIETFYEGETNILDAEIGDWRISQNATLINVLDQLRSKLGVLSYFRNGILNVNTEFLNDPDRNQTLIDVQRNVVQGSDNLQFQEDTDIGVISHGVSVQRDGTKIEVFATYKDNLPDNEIIVSDLQPIGVLNTIKIPDLTKQALTELTKMRLPKLFYTGATGDIQTFGFPSIDHGDTITLKNRRIPEVNGDYRIIKVKKEFTVSLGYKQKLTLGLKTG